MNTNNNHARLRVALLSINPRTQALLDYFFLSTGRSAYQACSEAEAEAAIFDFDHPESRLHWEAFHSASGLPGIAISIHEQHLPCTVWVPKPVAPMALLSAANAIQQGLWQPEPASEAPATSQAEPPGTVVTAETLAAPEPAAAPVIEEAPAAPEAATVAPAATPEATASETTPQPEALAPIETAVSTAAEAAPLPVTVAPAKAESAPVTAPATDTANKTAAPAKKGWLSRLTQWLHHEEAKPAAPAASGVTTDTPVTAVAADPVSAETPEAPVAETAPPPEEATTDTVVATPPEAESRDALPATEPEPAPVTTVAETAGAAPLESALENAPESIPEAEPAPETTSSTPAVEPAAVPVAEPAPPAEALLVQATPVQATAPEASLTQGTARLVSRHPDPAEAETTIPEAAKASNAAPAPAYKINPEELAAERRFCGEREDMSVPDIQNSKDLFYNPTDYLLAALKEAYLVGGKWRVPAHVDFEHGGITYIPESNQAYLEFPETDLSAHCAKPLPKFLKVRMVAKNELPALKEKFAQGVLLERFDARLWLAGLETAQGRLPQGTDVKQTVYLKHWPNLTRFQITPHALRIAALWATRGGDLIETAEVLKIPQRHVFAFYNAAFALDLVTHDDSHIRRAEKGRHRSHGMFSRLFKWLRN